MEAIQMKEITRPKFDLSFVGPLKLWWRGAQP
jgi:hypothetical protein